MTEDRTHNGRQVEFNINTVHHHHHVLANNYGQFAVPVFAVSPHLLKYNYTFQTISNKSLTHLYSHIKAEWNQ